MTSKLAPDSPPLEMDGKPAAQPGETVADSDWGEMPEQPGEKEQKNLSRIARGIRAKKETQ